MTNLLDCLSERMPDTTITFSHVENTEIPERTAVPVGSATVFCHRQSLSQGANFKMLDHWWYQLPRAMPTVDRLFTSLAMLHDFGVDIFTSFPIVTNDLNEYWKQIVTPEKMYLAWLPQQWLLDGPDCVLFDIGDSCEVFEDAVRYMAGLDRERLLFGYYEDRLVVASAPERIGRWLYCGAIGIHLGDSLYLFGDVLINLNASFYRCVGKDVLTKDVVFSTSERAFRKCVDVLLSHDR